MFIGFIVKQKNGSTYLSHRSMCRRSASLQLHPLPYASGPDAACVKKKYHTIGGNHSAFAFANIVQSLDINKRYGENVACKRGLFCLQINHRFNYIKHFHRRFDERADFLCRFVCHRTFVQRFGTDGSGIDGGHTLLELIHG